MPLPPLLEPLAQVSPLLLLGASGHAWLGYRALTGRSAASPRPVLLTGQGIGWSLVCVSLWLALEALDPWLRAHAPARWLDALQTLPALAVLPTLALSQRVQAIPTGWRQRAGTAALLGFPLVLALATGLVPGSSALAERGPEARTFLTAVETLQIGFAGVCALVAGVLLRRRYAGLGRARRGEWIPAAAAGALPLLVAALCAVDGAPAWQGLTWGAAGALPLLAWLFEADHAGGAALRRLLDTLGADALLVDDRCLVIHATSGALSLLAVEAVRPHAHINTLAPLLGRLLIAGRSSGRIGLRNAKGEPIEVEVVVGGFALGGLGFRGRVVTLRELTRKRELAQRIRRMAFHDELTGIANRRSFMKELARFLERMAETGDVAALLYLDLDGFKELNDTLGHAAGDEALRAVAHRLRQTLRVRSSTAGEPHTSLARIGGDEFAILVKGFERPEQVEDVANAVLALSREPLWTTDQTVSLSFSIGAAYAPRDGATPKELFQRADLALYHAKRAGCGRLVAFDPSLEEETSRTSDVKHHLRGAIENEEFKVHYQPKIDLETRKIIGAEALLRWRHDALGSIGPSEFIPIAEAANLIEGIGTWVLEATCQQIRDWRDGGLDVPPIAVNVSGRQIGEDFPQVVSRALRRFSLEPDAIEIELTESTLLGNAEATDHCLAELHAMGIRIALDDFGTGYSALAYLTRMPLSVLKLDRSLVRNIHEDHNAESVSAAVISMAHRLGLRVVAEGVDCEEQVGTLQAIGCDEAQGFLFSAALPPPEFAALLDAPAAGAARPAAAREALAEPTAEEETERRSATRTADAAAHEALPEPDEVEPAPAPEPERVQAEALPEPDEDDLADAEDGEVLPEPDVGELLETAPEEAPVDAGEEPAEVEALSEEEPVAAEALPEGDAAEPALEAPDSRFAMLIDDGSGALGEVALRLTRLGVLVLYTPFQDEAHLLVEQEAGNIRALLISPGVDLTRVEKLARQIGRALDGAPVTQVVVGDDPGPERRAALRENGVSWALWSPFEDDALRFVVESALLLPAEMASRAEPRIPADLSVAFSTSKGSGLGRILSLSAGGAYVHANRLPELGSHIELGFGLDGTVIETGARVAHVSERQVSWRPSFPRGFGVAFEDLDPEHEARLRVYVKATLARYAP